MKNYLKNYLTPSDQKVLMIVIIIIFISLLAVSKPFNFLYSNEVSPDSIRSDIKNSHTLCVDIKTASKDELTQIKGIGAKTADNIINFRDSVDIKSNYDLLNIKGIGEKSLAKWLPFLKALPNDSIKHASSQQYKGKTLSIKGKKDINKATKSDLMKVKGIGENRANQIIEFRNERKGLEDMQELLSIKGIGKKTLAKIEQLFYIGKN